MMTRADREFARDGGWRAVDPRRHRRPARSRAASRPRSVVTQRTTCAICVMAMRTMPSAASIGSRPSGSAIFSASAFFAASRSSCISPPRKRSAPRRPSTRLASVMVGSVPPSAVADRPRRGARALRARRAARCRPRRARCCRRRCRPPGCRSSASARAGRWRSRRSAPTGHQHVAIVDHAGLRGRAAHVERNRIRQCRSARTAPCVPMTPAAGPDSSMRMHAPRIVEIEQAAVRLHDQEFAARMLHVREDACISSR